MKLSPFELFEKDTKQLKLFIIGALLILALAVSVLPERISSLLIAFPLLPLYYIAAYLAGKCLLTGISLDFDNVILEKISLIMLGFGFISLSLLFLSQTGLIRHAPYSYAMPAFILLAYRFWRLKKVKNPIPASKKQSEQQSGAIPKVLWVLAVALVSVIGICALVPEVFHDSLLYHLALPQQTLIQGKLIAMSHNFTNFLPLGGEMLYIPLSANDYACRLFQFSLSLTLLLLITFSQNGKKRIMALIGGLSLYTILYFSFTSVTTLVEINVALYGYLAVILFDKYFTQKKSKYLILSAIMIGLAAGTKYQGLLIAAGLIIAFLLKGLIQKISFRKIILGIVVYGFIVLVVLSPWMIRSMVLTGNPLFPALHQVFSSSEIDSKDISWILEVWARSTNANSAAGFFLFPFKSSFQRGGLACLVLLALIGFPLLLRKWKSSLTPLAVLSIYYTGWFFFAPQQRYLLPVLPLLVMALIPPLTRITEKREIRLAFAILFTVVFSLNFTYTLVQMHKMLRPFGFFLSSFNRQTYHSKVLTSPYGAILRLNEESDRNSKVLFIGESRGYNMKQKYHASSPYERQFISTLIEKSRGGQDLYNTIKKNGFNYILINFSEWQRTIEKLNLPRMNFAPRGSDSFEKLREMLRMCKIIYKDSHCLVFKLQ